MLAYLLLACFAVPLVLLLVDVMRPRKQGPQHFPAAPLRRAHVQTGARRPAHAPGESELARPPRIAPGDGMVYRGARRPDADHPSATAEDPRRSRSR